MVLDRLMSGDTDEGAGREGEACEAGTVFGKSRNPGGFVSYDPEYPFVLGGS